MTPDPLAALLHEPCVERWQSLRDNGGFGTTTHGVDAHEAAAARLRAAGNRRNARADCDMAAADAGLGSRAGHHEYREG